jgi:hypothetical protein
VDDQPRNAQSGRLSRRDLIRRGAIVGGSLLWVVPAVQSLTPAASASTGSPTFGCCECRNGPAGRELCNPGLDHKQCTTAGSGQPAGTGPASSTADCQQYCAAQQLAYCFHSSSSPNLTCVPVNGRSVCSGD